MKKKTKAKAASPRAHSSIVRQPSKSPAAAAARAKREEKTAMSDKPTYEELEARVGELTEMLTQAELERDRAIAVHAQLMSDLESEASSDEAAQVTTAEGNPPRGVQRYVRGKLPGDKLIRIDTSTDRFEEVTREEWEAIPAR